MIPTLVKDFIYKNRRCIVVRAEGFGSFIGTYHNGYVELKEDEIKDDYNEYKIECEEITYQGDLEHINGNTNSTFIGFDTAHYHNIEHPETQTALAVEECCKRIVDELEEQR